MILNAFSLEGKVAVVTGCDTGLGQGMALGLAEAGCDIVGINIVEPTETIARVTALGRRYEPEHQERVLYVSGGGKIFYCPGQRRQNY